MKCSEYMIDDDPEMGCCHCPVCGGFLIRFLPEQTSFRCRKCGTELMTFPEDPNDDSYGKICPISQSSIKNEEEKA